MSNTAHGRILFQTNPKYLQPYRQSAIRRNSAMGEKHSFEREAMNGRTGERTWM